MSQTVIDKYINGVNTPQRAELERVRDIIRALVPDAEETIGYGMPVFKFNKKYLIGFSAFKNHMSIFPGSGAIEALHDQLTDFKIAKGTIQFTVDKPLPESLLQAVIKNRLNDIKNS